MKNIFPQADNFLDALRISWCDLCQFLHQDGSTNQVKHFDHKEEEKIVVCCHSWKPLQEKLSFFIIFKWPEWRAWKIFVGNFVKVIDLLVGIFQFRIISHHGANIDVSQGNGHLIGFVYFSLHILLGEKQTKTYEW